MKKTFWIAFAVLGILVLFILVVGTSLIGNWTNWGWGIMGGWPTGTMHGWGFGSFGWTGIILMWLILIGFIVLVVFGVVVLVRSFSSPGEGSAIINQRDESKTSPREILQTRYASGEITREQYQQMLDDMN